MASPQIWLINGASRGIGLTYVKHLLQDPEDVKVIATARNPDKSQGLQELAKTTDRLTLLQLDVNDSRSVEAAAEEVAAKFGSLDYLINNAGTIGSDQRYDALDEPLEQIEAVFKTNVLGPLVVTRAFYPLLLKGTKKTIVNISSGAGSVSWHLEGVAAKDVQIMQSVALGYKISKAALNMQSAVLANTAKADGVIVISLHPGIVDTDMSDIGTKMMKIPKEAIISKDESVIGQLKVIRGLSPADNGKFFDNTGANPGF